MKLRSIFIIALFSIFVFSFCKRMEQKSETGQTSVKVVVKDGKLTPEVLMSLRRVNSPAFSPDGKWILYSMSTPNIDSNKLNTEIYKISFDGKTRVQLTDNPASDNSPVWSPDGRKIAFISTRDGEPQVYTMDADGGNVKKITSEPNGVSNLLWSPNGKYFSYTTDVKLEQTPKDKYPDLPKAKVRIYDKLPVRHWDEWTTENYTHLFIVPVDGGKPHDLMQGEKYDSPVKPFGGVEEIAWSPDGKEIAYTSKKVPNYVETTNADIFIFNIENGAVKNITDGMKGNDNVPLYSPDGNWIAFHSQQREGFESDRIRLMLYNRKTGEITELSKTLDQWVGQTVWAPDSKSLYFSAEDGATVQLYNIKVADGTWNILTKGWYNYDEGIDITKDGKTIAIGRRSMLTPPELFTMNADGSNITQVTFENKDIISQLKPAIMTERWITSTDGKKVQCWVLYPPDFDSTKKYPMITYCQGGPQSTISQYFSFRWNPYLMAAQGYIVLCPNRRGLPGFGQAWNDAISQDWAGKPMQDILAATDAMLKENYVNKSAVAAVGASAGGYAVFWLEGNHNKRFCAFVSHCGVFDMVSMYGSTEELWFPNWENGGPYWDPKYYPYYMKNSPHMFANNWDTPILISTGEFDFRVPYTQSLEAFTLAQEKHIPSELIIFPKESHWILHLQEQVLWHREFFRFLDTYCKK